MRRRVTLGSALLFAVLLCAGCSPQGESEATGAPSVSEPAPLSTAEGANEPPVNEPAEPAPAAPDTPAATPELSQPQPSAPQPPAQQTDPVEPPEPVEEPEPEPVEEPEPEPVEEPEPEPVEEPEPEPVEEPITETATPAAAVIDIGGHVEVGAPKEGLTRIGAEKCRICHKVQHASWLESSHGTRTPPLDCEDCHGPGSEYKGLKVMKDPVQARAAGLVTPSAAFCRQCHVADWSDDQMLLAHDHKPEEDE